ncbi:acetylxylan esterase [Rathayibacter sp. CAU 1779]
MAERFGFDPTHGYALTELLEIGTPEEPDDFDAFWAGISPEADAIELAIGMGAWSPLPDAPGVEVADLQFRSLDGRWIGGWLTRPRGGVAPARGFVIGHGYGGRDAPDVSGIPTDAVAVFPVARGLPTRSEVEGVGGATGLHHVLWGIRSPREYSHVGSVVDTWIAARVLRMLFPGIDLPVYIGGSFGGGIGALALAFGDRFSAGVLEVPSFGNHPLRVAVPSTGSAAVVREYVVEHPEVMETLRYADAASAALRVTVPVLVLPALADPSVPPQGQFAVANALGGPTWVHVLPHGHCAGGDGCEDSGRADAVARFLAEVAAGSRA